MAVAAAGGATIVATTLSCLLAELSGVGRTHLGVARARRAAARHRFGGGGAVACGACLAFLRRRVRERSHRWRRGEGLPFHVSTERSRVDGVAPIAHVVAERERDHQEHTGAVAFGLVSQAAQHAKATGTIPAEATNAALLCESACLGTRATRRRTRGSERIPPSGAAASTRV